MHDIEPLVVGHYPQAHLDFQSQALTLPRPLKEALTKTVIVASHPHGAPMFVSHGDLVQLYYTTEINDEKKTHLAKVTRKKAGLLFCVFWCSFNCCYLFIFAAINLQGFPVWKSTKKKILETFKA